MGTSLLWQTDNQLHDSVQRELGWASDVDATGVAVIARCDGVVTLTGFVDSYWQKYAVEAAAKRVRGVRAVANDVHIRLSKERIDPEIAHDAVLALQRWPGVPRTVMVTVRDGFLTLEGRVERNDQRSDAESAVRARAQGARPACRYWFRWSAVTFAVAPALRPCARDVGRRVGAGAGVRLQRRHDQARDERQVAALARYCRQ